MLLDDGVYNIVFGLYSHMLRAFDVWLKGLHLQNLGIMIYNQWQLQQAVHSHFKVGVGECLKDRFQDCLDILMPECFTGSICLPDRSSFV